MNYPQHNMGLASTADNIRALIDIGKHMEEQIYLEGYHRKFYQSRLDGSTEFYSVHVLENYDANRAYPLILYVSTFCYNNYARSRSG